MEKRISSRGIIIDGDKVYLFFRRKRKENGVLKEYYAIPGGGLEEGETLRECVIRELREEISIEVDVLGYLGMKETENSIEYFYHCKMKEGIPKLGGEELERCSENNYYEIRKINIFQLDE